MFRISYIDKITDEIKHKGNFNAVTLSIMTLTESKIYITKLSNFERRYL